MSIELALLSRVCYRDVELTGSRLRGLLALLAADARSGCSTTRLVDALWPDELPEHPTKALQVLVSRARARLGPDAIASTPTGYRLALPDDQVDATAVVRHATVSERHARNGEHAEALAEAEAGLALCVGAEAWGIGTAGDPVEELRAARLSTYRSLSRSRALALSRLGRRAEARDGLAALIERQPRDEEVLAELVRCEAAILGPATALARYDTYRRALRDELGSEPGPALRAVHADLLNAGQPSVRHGVQYDPNPLLGRDRDVAEVAALLRIARVTSIVGAGGLGKTRLAHVVSRAAEQRAVHFVGLAGVTADDDVLGEVASTLGIGEPRHGAVGRGMGASALGGIVNALGPGPALLVLDNCEHVVRGAADLVRSLVSMSRDLRVLTTSRAPLGLSSESVYLLPELSPDVAVTLFMQRARAARPGVDLPEAAVGELCAHLDGLPLAVELAAARVRVMSVVDIARRIDDRFALLRGGSRDAPQRHRTLHAVIDWSWQLLAGEAQAALRALSIFPDGFGVDAARHVVETDDDDQDVLPILEQLVEQSLLTVIDTEPGARFRMLETVREFTGARRDEAGETEAATARFLDWATDFGIARSDSTFSADLIAFTEQARIEQDNLIQALRYGLDREDGRVVAATSAVLSGLWLVESNFARIAGLATDIGRVLARYQPEPRLVEVARTALVLCTLSAFLIQGREPPRLYRALRDFPAAPPDSVIRATQFVLAAISGDFRSLFALCDSDEPLVAGMANAVASYAFEAENDVDGALLAARRMADVFDEQESLNMRVVAHARIGELSLQSDPGEPALAHLNIAMATVEKLGARATLARGRWAIVLANLQRGDLAETERMLGEALLLGDDQSVGLDMFDMAVRATVSIVRGDVDAGLLGWRATVAGLREQEGQLGVWPLEIQSVCVVAHAQHGRLDAVTDLVAAVPESVTAIIGADNVRPAAFPACGAALLAIAMTDLKRDPTGAARMIALARRMHYLRGFHPIMSVEAAEQAARDADGPAYDDAMSSYAGLDNPGLRQEVLARLRNRLSDSDPA